LVEDDDHAKERRMNDRNDEPIVGSDQTNGLAGNLEGDDGGAVNPDDRMDNVVAGVVRHLDDEDDAEPDESGETKYSEEGAE
jgi:hypothetical protein